MSSFSSWLDGWNMHHGDSLWCELVFFFGCFEWCVFRPILCFGDKKRQVVKLVDLLDQLKHPAWPSTILLLDNCYHVVEEYYVIKRYDLGYYFAIGIMALVHFWVFLAITPTTSTLTAATLSLLDTCGLILKSHWSALLFEMMRNKLRMKGTSMSLLRVELCKWLVPRQDDCDEQLCQNENLVGSIDWLIDGWIW